MISAISLGLWASGLALLLSIGAALAAAHSWHLSRSSSAARLSARLSAAESSIEDLSSDFKAIRAAANMRAHRAKQLSAESSPDPPPAPSDDADKTRRELNRKLATGEIKPRGIA